jgi:hypothetical protein
MNTKSPAPGRSTLVLFLSRNVDLANRLGHALYARGIDLHRVQSSDELAACLRTLGIRTAVGPGDYARRFDLEFAAHPTTTSV